MEYPRKDTLLMQLKALLNVSASDDKSLEFTLDKVVRDVAIYCNIEVNDIPEDLDYTIISIILTFTKTHDLISSGQGNIPNNLQTITEGTTTTTFKSPAEVLAQIQAVNSITDDYRAQLNHYRKLKR